MTAPRTPFSEVPVDDGSGGVSSYSIGTLRDEMAMSGQSQLVASGQMLLAAHTQSTGLDNSS
jgi:hypothetical protein